MSNAAKRMEMHSQAWTLVEKGQYLDGLDVFVEAIENYGPHVGLLSDMVATYYLMGRIDDADFTLKRLEQEYSKAESSLSERSKACTLIFLGKMYEEKAYLSKSLFYYQKASELPGIDRDTKIRSLCQILRLKSYIAPDETLSLVYETLVHAKTENENLITELQHSLMLAELSLFGHNFAKHRMLRALENKQNVSDERLIVADYLAECLRFNLPIEQSLVNKGQENLEEADHFERFIFEMATKHQHADPSSENIFELFHFMQNKIYLFNQIRLLDLIAHISPDPKIKTEAQRIISFKALSLPQEDRTLIHNRFLQTNQEINSLSLSRTKLFYAGQEVEIKTNIYKMLELLTSNPQFEVEQFCIAFYEESYSLSHFDRLRVFVIRTNEKLTKALGTKPLKLTKNHLEWRGPNISLTSK